MTIVDRDYADPGVAVLLGEVQQEYVVRYGGPDASPIDPADFAPPDGAFLVALCDDQMVGCAGLRCHDEFAAEIKRMYVRATHRRRGHARQLLLALEQRARALGYARIVLETASEQPEALALYAMSGYEPVPAFGHYRCAPQSRHLGKRLDPALSRPARRPARRDR